MAHHYHDPAAAGTSATTTIDNNNNTTTTTKFTRYRSVRASTNSGGSSPRSPRPDDECAPVDSRSRYRARGATAPPAPAPPPPPVPLKDRGDLEGEDRRGARRATTDDADAYGYAHAYAPNYATAQARRRATPGHAGAKGLGLGLGLDDEEAFGGAGAQRREMLARSRPADEEVRHESESERSARMQRLREQRARMQRQWDDEDGDEHDTSHDTLRHTRDMVDEHYSAGGRQTTKSTTEVNWERQAKAEEDRINRLLRDPPRKTEEIPIPRRARPDPTPAVVTPVERAPSMTAATVVPIPKDIVASSARSRALTATTTHTSTSTASERLDTPTTSVDTPQGIAPGGGGIVPGIDAPMSAVNAGERRVLIRCKQSSINLPVTPETTSTDLISSAANVMTQDIVTSRAVLLESYIKLGLERRIRRYEHVRDILNSWDRDTQNALVIEHVTSSTAMADLHVAAAPKEAPRDVSVYMYHSQRPGKWTKKHITLLSTGQVFTAKKEHAKLSDKDVQTICHLSDFDIYAPTTTELRKNLRPPKKLCYAVRSQQKTSMFLSSENYVHYFSTDDAAAMQRWYAAVQAWRSYYLVQALGEGQRPIRAPATTLVATKLPPGAPGQKKLTHKVSVSVDEDPYTLGSFKPLLNMDRFDGSMDQRRDDSDDENRPLHVPAHLRGGHTAVQSRRADPKQCSSHAFPSSAQSSVASGGIASGGGGFASNSLLGRTYSQRQRAQRDDPPPASTRTKSITARSRPGSGSVSAGAHAVGLASTAAVSAPISHTTSASFHANNTFPSSTNANNAATNATNATNPFISTTSTTTKPKPKPLLDFTPHFEEPNPLWSSKGKGRGVQAPEGTRLVDVATGGAPVGLMRGVVGGAGGMGGSSSTVVFRREG